MLFGFHDNIYAFSLHERKYSKVTLSLERSERSASVSTDREPFHECHLHMEFVRIVDILADCPEREQYTTVNRLGLHR